MFFISNGICVLVKVLQCDIKPKIAAERRLYATIAIVVLVHKLHTHYIRYGIHTILSAILKLG